MAKICKFRKKNGARCTADAQTGKDVCVFHDPERIEEGRRARRAGGIKRSRRAAVLSPDTPDCPLTNVLDISRLIADCINQVRRGELDARVANTIGFLAGIQLRSFEQGALDQRLARMESVLGIVAPSPVHRQKEVSGEGDSDGND